MSDLIRLPATVAVPSDARREAAHVKRRLSRTKAKCLALSMRSEWCSRLRESAKRRGATTIREVLTGPNFLLLISLSLFGTTIFWIIGDMMHWLLGVVFAAVGLCLSFMIVLRVTFNATLFSDEQLAKIQSASTGRLSLLNADVAKLDAELKRLKPLVEAEILYEREINRLQAEKAADDERRRQIEKLDERMRDQFHRSGSPPTQKQLRFAAHLKIKLTGKESKEELSLLIDRVLQKQTPAQESESKRRWMQQEHQIERAEREKATIREIEDALEVNRDMGELYVIGFVVIRGEDCGTKNQGKFIKIGTARNELKSMPPFDDCNFYNCGCEIIQVLKGETAARVFREYMA